MVGLSGVRIPVCGGIYNCPSALSREIQTVCRRSPPGLGSQIDAGLTDYEKLDLRTGTRCLEELFVNCCLQ